MKLRVLMVMVVLAVLFFITGILYAANGDLIVNGNLGVGTATPQGKAEVNGNMVVDGNLGVGTTSPTEKAEVNGNLKVSGTVTSGGQTVNGNLCVGGNCTNSLHVSGGVYGYCTASNTSLYGIYGCESPLSPALCFINGYYQSCACPSGYTKVIIGATGTATSGKTYYACYKN